MHTNTRALNVIFYLDIYIPDVVYRLNTSIYLLLCYSAEI